MINDRLNKILLEEILFNGQTPLNQTLKEIISQENISNSQTPLNQTLEEIIGSTGIPGVCPNKELPTSRGLSTGSSAVDRFLDPADKLRDVEPREFRHSQIISQENISNSQNPEGQSGDVSKHIDKTEYLNGANNIFFDDKYKDLLRDSASVRKGFLAPSPQAAAFVPNSSSQEGQNERSSSSLYSFWSCFSSPEAAYMAPQPGMD